MSDIPTYSINIETDIYEKIKEITSSCENLKRCILGEDCDIILKSLKSFKLNLSDPILALEWSGSIINITSLFLYSKFNMVKRESNMKKGIPNLLYLKRLLCGLEKTVGFDKPSASLRLLRVLDGIYHVYDMNLMVMRYIITNAQIETGTYHRAKPGLTNLIDLPKDNHFKLSCDINNYDEYDFEMFGYKLENAFNYISSCRIDKDFFGKINDPEQNLTEKSIDSLFRVLHALDFISKVKIKINDDGVVDFIEETKKSTKKISSYGVVKVFAVGENKDDFIEYTEGCEPKYFFLKKIKYSNDKSYCELEYKSFDEFKTKKVYIYQKEDSSKPTQNQIFVDSIVDFYHDTIGYLSGSLTEAYYFANRVTEDYRDHNIFAPAISDAIDDIWDSKIKILQEYIKNDRETYKDMFKPIFSMLKLKNNKMKDVEEDKNLNDNERWKKQIDIVQDYIQHVDHQQYRLINWDIPIAKILEGSASGLFQSIFAEHSKKRASSYGQIEKVCKEIVNGIEMRFFYSSNTGENIKSFANQIMIFQNQVKGYLDEKLEKLKDKIPEKYYHEARCNALIYSYSESINKFLKNEIHVDSIESQQWADNGLCSKIAIIQNLIKTNISGKKEMAETVFVQIIKSFLSFYAGIQSCIQSWIKYDMDSRFITLSENKSIEHKKNIDDSFFIGVSKEVQRLSSIRKGKNLSETYLLELWDFAKTTAPDSKRMDDIKKIHSCSEAIFDRTPINYDSIKKIYTVDENRNIHFVGRKGEGVIFFDEVLEEKNDAIIDIYIERLADIMILLNGGADATFQSSLDQEELVKKVVYPHVVVYTKKHTDRGEKNKMIMEYTGLFSSFLNGEVSVFSQLNYDLNHTYYALPKHSNSGKDKWYHPILISCNMFDKCLTGNEAEIGGQDAD